MTITQTAEWQALEQHLHQVKSLHLRELFAKDETRGARLSLEVDGIYLDYSKNRLTDETVELLVELAGRPDSGPGSTPCSRARRST